MVKDLLEFVISKFDWHPFYNESLAFLFSLAGFEKTDL